MFRSRYPFAGGLLLLAMLVSSCVTETTGPVEQQNLHEILRATITGKIIDFCTGRAVAGAVVSVGYDGGVTHTTSDASGSFSFGDVPVSRYEVLNGQVIANDIYTVTASFVDYNAAQTNPMKRYRDYYFAQAQVTYSSREDSSQVIGLIGSVTFMVSELNTSIKGSVVDKDMQPVSGAVVTLYDNTINFGAVISQTSTNASGDYQFTGVDNGIAVTLQAQNANGTMRGNLPGVLGLSCNLPVDSLYSQVTAERIRIVDADNVAPYVISTTPVNNADVSPTGLSIVYTFSEPIKQTPYTRTDLGVGHATIVDDITLNYNGLKKAALEIPYAASWNASFTQLTITSTDVVGSARYALTFSVAAGKLQDNAGLALVNNASVIGDFEALNFTTAGNSTVPAAPVVSRRLIPGLFADVDFAGGSVSLSWQADAAARSYNVYRKSGSGAFELIVENLYALQYSETTPALVTPYVFPTQRDPLAAAPTEYVVYGVSKDLVVGPVSNTVTISDAVKPQLTSGTMGGAIATNQYPFTLNFSEPLNKTAAETVSNFTFSNTGGVTYTVARADYLGWQGASYVVRLTVNTSAVPIPGAVLTIGNNVVDLTGNNIDSAANSQTF